MKLYKITSPFYDFGDGASDSVYPQQRRWEGTQADARKRRIACEEPFKGVKPANRPRVEVEEVDVPTDKAGLLAFLNTNAV